MNLLSLGPINVSDEIKNLKLDNISHRSEKFKILYSKLESKIKERLNIISNYSILFIPGSGTAGVEAIISSTVASHPGYKENILVCSNGSFGERWGNIADLYNLNVFKYQNGWGAPFDYANIINIVKSQKINNILLVHHETSVNIVNDLTEISKLCTIHNINLFVDMVSSFGSEEIDLSKLNITACTFSSNKGGLCYPGVSVVVGKSTYFEQVNPKQVPYYLNLNNYYTYSLNKQTPTTPNVSIMQQFLVSLEYKNQFIDIELLNSKFKKLGIFPINVCDNKSKAFNTYYCKNVSEFYNYCFSNNFSIYKYTKGYTIDKAFQLSTIGYANVPKFIELLDTYKPVKNIGLPIIILVAGMGTRMQNNFATPKCLIKINGISILERQIQNIIQVNKLCDFDIINKLILVVGHEKEVIKQESTKLAQKYSLPIEFVENTNYASTNTCKSVLEVMKYPELISNGYYLIDGDLVMNEHILYSMCVFPDSCAAISRNESLNQSINDPEAVCVKLDNYLITNIGKKMGESNGESIGLYKLTKQLLDNSKIQYYLEQSEDQEYYEDSFQRSIEDLKNFYMTGIDFTGYVCMEIDTIDDYNDIINQID